MRKLLAILVLSVLTAGAASATGKGPRREDVPNRYLPRSLDGEIVRVRNDVDGRVWSAWAYRNGAEYDLAVSVSSEPGVWSEPQLIGLDDGIDQGSPAFTVDERGSVYLAYADSSGTIAVRALRAGSDRWSAPVGLSDARGPLSAPKLVITGSALVLGFRLGDGVEMIVLPLLPPPGNNVASIYDGPDPTGGREEGDEDDETQSAFGFGEPNQNGGFDLRPHEGLGEED